MNISESSMINALLAAGRRSRVIHMNETHHFRQLRLLKKIEASVDEEQPA